MTNESIIRDINLAEKGQEKLDWVKNYMPVLNKIKDDFIKTKPFEGLRIAICLHLEAKTGYLGLVLKEGGADVTVTASNPLSTQDDVVAALVKNGVRAFACHGASDEEYHEHHKCTLSYKPNLVIDDGGDLISLIHTEYKDLIPDIIGGCEETTTGIIRLKSMENEGILKFPVVAVNNAFMKSLFDNRYGTGQSVWDGIMNTTNLTIAGKKVVVTGYGWCGKGVAMRAKGLGAKVIITEIDPIKANEALLDGFEVMTMDKAAALGNIFVTVTGNKGVIRKEHFDLMQDGAILSNAGHFDVEISKPGLLSNAEKVRRIKPNIDEYLMKDGRKLYLLAEGRLVNLASGNGHPAEIMDLSFAIQALSLLYLKDNKGELNKGVIPVTDEIDKEVATLRLQALGIEIDRLTNEQVEYLNNWAI